MALGSQLTPWTPRLFAWQARHLETWTVTLRGRRGTWRHRPSLCVELTPWTPRLFVWQAWHLATSTSTLRIYGTGLALVARLDRHCVAGVALMALGWLWWRFVPVWRRGRRRCLRGRRGTWKHGPSLCVAGVALGDIDLHFAWPV